MPELYENLEVYKKALDLAVHFEKLVIGFDKRHKYAIGIELRNISRRIVVLVANANIKQRRKQCLDEAIDLLEEIKIVNRIAKEVGAFRSFKSFEYASKLIINVAKQCEGWVRSSNSLS